MQSRSKRVKENEESCEYSVIGAIVVWSLVSCDCCVQLNSIV